MAGISSINAELLHRAQAFAEANSVPIETVIEEALSSYLGSQPSAAEHSDKLELPVATTLEMISPDSCNLSYDKLLESAICVG
jgi:hypothetical protein